MGRHKCRASTHGSHCRSKATLASTQTLLRPHKLMDDSPVDSSRSMCIRTSTSCPQVEESCIFRIRVPQPSGAFRYKKVLLELSRVPTSFHSMDSLLTGSFSLTFTYRSHGQHSLETRMKPGEETPCCPAGQTPCCKYLFPRCSHSEATQHPTSKTKSRTQTRVSRLVRQSSLSSPSSKTKT